MCGDHVNPLASADLQSVKHPSFSIFKENYQQSKSLDDSALITLTIRSCNALAKQAGGNAQANPAMQKTCIVTLRCGEVQYNRNQNYRTMRTEVKDHMSMRTLPRTPPWGAPQYGRRHKPEGDLTVRFSPRAKIPPERVACEQSFRFNTIPLRQQATSPQLTEMAERVIAGSFDPESQLECPLEQGAPMANEIQNAMSKSLLKDSHSNPLPGEVPAVEATANGRTPQLLPNKASPLARFWQEGAS